MRKFAALTREKRAFNSQTHEGRSLVLRVNTCPRRATASAPRMPCVSKVYFWKPVVSDIVKHGEKISRSGSAWKAQLVVMDGLSGLFEVHEDDDAKLADLVAIVGLGLPVVKRSDWLAASGEAGKLKPENVVFHKRLVHVRKVRFKVPSAFPETRPRTFEALKACFKAAGSLWRKDSGVVGSRGEEIVDASDCVSWFLQHRRVVNCAVFKAVKAD